MPKKPRAIRIKIRGKIWRVEQRPAIKLEGREVRGFCDKSERLIVHDGGPDMAFTLIHEVLHACLWDLDETAIEETEEAIKTVLSRTGLIDM
jgi:hypothetical protein